MSVFSSPVPLLSPPAVVTRLRSAGCVFAEDEARLLMSAARTPADLAAMVERRATGLPLEHVLGWVEFCGLRMAVDPGVFVPRRRTEFLTHQASVLIRRMADPAGPVRQVPARPRPVVVDLCCGSGAIGAALAAAAGSGKSHPIELHAVDIDSAAVRCARHNVAAAGGRVYEGDLYDALPSTLRGRVDVLVASAPYVPTEEIGLLPPEARLHEPRTALDGGADGLDVIRRVIAEAPSWLVPGGHLLIETSESQAQQTVESVTRSGLIPYLTRSDDLDATTVIGTRPSPGAAHDKV